MWTVDLGNWREAEKMVADFPWLNEAFRKEAQHLAYLALQYGKEAEAIRAELQSVYYRRD